MKHPETIPRLGSDDNEGRGAERSEGMVEATKISTVFSEQEVLEEIADSLLSRGLISGFHINPVLSGYIHKGGKVQQQQYSLEILLDNQTDERVRGEIRMAIESAIGEKWDVPAIEEEQVMVNKELLGFIKRAEIEHRKYLTQRRLTLTVALSAFLSISAMMGVLTKEYFDKREREAVAAEHAESYRKISGLEKEVNDRIMKLEIMLAEGKSLTPAESDVAGQTAYQETDDILMAVQEVQEEMQKLNKSPEK